ncbi:UNVERIFIED_CONTAM: hypothetical protein K2H54_059284 [Gekko kuhli]
MKPLKEPLANNNNNVSFVIHCHIGKEIKHICSNCSRGEEAPDVIAMAGGEESFLWGTSTFLPLSTVKELQSELA